ncbi:hypothetical protein [Paraburkholderia sacchari]|uniref:hypothetical protein n=1 Tax=Paraburkholderia sacchari TaxID=159450 RepID=UPI003D97B2B4
MSEIQTEQQVDPEQIEQQPEQKPDTSWVPKRISEITAARRAAEARVAELEAELARSRQSAPVEGQTTQPAASREDFERLVNARADALATQRTHETTMKSRIDAINAAGTKEFGEDFDKSVQNLNMAGIGGPEFLKVLTSIDGAEKLVTYLGKSENINEAMRIASLDPIQMGIEMTKLSGKAAKALSKQISKAPPPIQTVEGGGSANDATEPDPSDTKKWMEWRKKTARRR